MFLELHDAEIGNTLMGVARNIDYQYQAEQWVIETAKDKLKAVKWILFDESGNPLRQWIRNKDDVQEVSVSANTKADPKSFKRN